VQALSPHVALTKVPLPVNRRFARSVGVLMAAVDEIIQTGSADMLDTLNGHFPPDVVRAEIITMLVAGTETAAVTLNWLFYELGLAPDIMARVVGELDAELRPGEDVTDEQLSRLTYTRHVTREVLRRHTPNSFLMRQATQAITLGGRTIPAGAELMFSLTTLHRHPAVFPDPMRFDPDRWLAERSRPHGGQGDMPFGAGRHKCIGDEFSWRQMAVVVAAVLRRWRLDLVAAADVREVAWTTVQPRGVRVRLGHRLP
jgi:cytochrome P450